MQNKSMEAKLDKLDAMDVRVIGFEVEPGVFELSKFTEDMDYCDVENEQWIWSIGKREKDGKIFASTDARFYQKAGYECLWLR
jgi:hypothetical protein